MPKFLDAPNGERSTVDGTEIVPLGSSNGLSSWWSSVSTIKNYIKTVTDTLYSAFNHTHADSDNGGVVNHTVLTGAGTSLHVPTYSSDSNTFLSGTGEWLTPTAVPGNVYDSDVLFTDIVTNNSSITKHGFLPKLSGDSTSYLNGDGEWTVPPAGGSVYDSDILFSDITTNNSSITQHGFLPKLSGDSNQYLNGDGEWIDFITNRVIANTIALTATEGYLRWDSTRKHIILYDAQRERGITPIGWQPYAYPIGYSLTGTLLSPTALVANGGSVALPVQLIAPMLLQSVSVRNYDTGTQRTWGWDLYEQYLNNGNGAENTLTRVAASAANETFTPSGAASTRTINAGSAPVFLSPGLYWLVIQCRHATNNFGLDGVSSNSFAPNLIQTKTTTNPNGATLDFVAASWTKGPHTRCCRLDGRVFGETSAF